MKKISGNTILITGGGSGIGLALAEALKGLDNQILIAGRSKSKLEAAAKKGFKTFEVDMMDLQSIQTLAKKVTQEFPALNAVIHNAGIMKTEILLEADTSEIAADTVNTNLLGPIRLTQALLAHLKTKPYAMIMTVTSGLAFVPLTLTPTYSASKAALHSYTESLRYQLAKTNIEVFELAPPYVQTELTGAHQATDPNAMPLAEYISEVISLLKSKPASGEILVQRVHPLRFAEQKGAEAYSSLFFQMNNARWAAVKK